MLLYKLAYLSKLNNIATIFKYLAQNLYFYFSILFMSSPNVQTVEKADTLALGVYRL